MYGVQPVRGKFKRGKRDVNGSFLRLSTADNLVCHILQRF
jgi:hypothetical protein